MSSLFGFGDPSLDLVLLEELEKNIKEEEENEDDADGERYVRKTDRNRK